MILVLSGDLCQYPPVRGSPLYCPITDESKTITDFELSKRLGRLAWRTVTHVVEFTEQYRMKGDPEYADAVSRLRVRSCTEADVDMFNSRVIKSEENTNGIDMSVEPYINSTVIVARNIKRIAINFQKGKSQAQRLSKTIIYIAAHDISNKKTVPNFPKYKSRQCLLKMDITKFSNDGALPGYIALYDGMPVIVKGKNISTELKITNGAQGFVRYVSTFICSEGFCCAEAIFVEVPGCNVQLDGLPYEVIPILPSTWTFSTNIEVGEGLLSRQQVSRHQIYLEGGFAITGHGSQGRTINPVLCDLHEGGFAAYVMASRCSEKKSLCISQTVSIDQLNKPLPENLKKELNYLSVLENNTLVSNGFIDGVMMQLPDCDLSLRDQCSSKINLHISPKKNLKRKQEAPLTVQHKKKKKQTQTKQDTKLTNPKDPQIIQPQIPHLQIQGCQWSTDWSCAYDSAFMAFYFTYKTSEAALALRISETNLFSDSFTQLLNACYLNPLPYTFNTQRDKFRDILFQHNQREFPRYGPKSCISL